MHPQHQLRPPGTFCVTLCQYSSHSHLTQSLNLAWRPVHPTPSPYCRSLKETALSDSLRPPPSVSLHQHTWDNHVLSGCVWACLVPLCKPHLTGALQVWAHAHSPSKSTQSELPFPPPGDPPNPGSDSIASCVSRVIARWILYH